MFLHKIWEWQFSVSAEERKRWNWKSMKNQRIQKLFKFSNLSKNYWNKVQFKILLILKGISKLSDVIILQWILHFTHLYFAWRVSWTVSFLFVFKLCVNITFSLSVPENQRIFQDAFRWSQRRWSAKVYSRFGRLFEKVRQGKSPQFCTFKSNLPTNVPNCNGSHLTGCCRHRDSSWVPKTK